MYFFFKQKTAYEMRISDWSSDVCSSDLSRRASEFQPRRIKGTAIIPGRIERRAKVSAMVEVTGPAATDGFLTIGIVACGCDLGTISLHAVRGCIQHHIFIAASFGEHGGSGDKKQA